MVDLGFNDSSGRRHNYNLYGPYREVYFSLLVFAI